MDAVEAKRMCCMFYVQGQQTEGPHDVEQKIFVHICIHILNICIRMLFSCMHLCFTHMCFLFVYFDLLLPLSSPVLLFLLPP